MLGMPFPSRFREPLTARYNYPQVPRRLPVPELIHDPFAEESTPTDHTEGFYLPGVSAYIEPVQPVWVVYHHEVSAGKYCILLQGSQAVVLPAV